MSIKFVCSCGKRLKARDVMAARRSVCPRCGSPVGIPVQTKDSETPLELMTPAERVHEQMRRLVRQSLPADAAAPAFGIGTAHRPAVVPPPASPPRQAQARVEAPPEPKIPGQLPFRDAPGRGRHFCPRCRGLIETRWYLCLLYPAREIARILVFALILAGSLAALALILPHLVFDDLRLGYQLIALAPIFLVSLVVFGYASAFLQSILSAAIAGDAPEAALPWPNMASAQRCGVLWLICFLAGPAVPGGIGFFYWIHCGDPNVIDWLIITELAIVTLGYWLFCLLALERRGRLLDLNPLRVARVKDWLGGDAFLAAALFAVLVLIHSAWAVFAVQQMHTSFSTGWLILAGCCFSAMFWAAFLFRLTGVWCHLSRRRENWADKV
jgi:hypothetical protein